ncbi:hypothetical protein [Cellulomonas phragmiteti]|uniref:Uncharacterized protein n=1 Tax=Cellulomonas phragmiteti TaxID=478780 RepID=A0ABQ4DPR5_9CELL|nr:hypothetical protein [Cellulomonas phragmiteti]GIG41329.1 hypothetical protein Cph01nite_30910 [Cellulomonas phragmiteti]
MRGRGHHEPWGEEPRHLQLRRVLLGLGGVVAVAALVAGLVLLLG